MSETQFTAKRLKELQALPLDEKIAITRERIIEWYEHFNGKVCVSFSGGKDSTVLLHLVRELYPDVPAVFSDTGLEYPEIKEHVKRYDNVEIVRPRMTFKDVIVTYGYPLVSKETAEAIQYARRHIGGVRPTETAQRSWERDETQAARPAGTTFHRRKTSPATGTSRGGATTRFWRQGFQGQLENRWGGSTQRRKRVELTGNRMDSEPG